MQHEEVLSQTSHKLYSFDHLKMLTGGDSNFLTSLAKIFVTSTVQNSEELLHAAQSNSWLTVSKMAHKMKSTIDNINIESIKKDIRILETDGKDEINTPVLLSTAIKVHQTIDRVAGQIRKEFNL